MSCCSEQTVSLTGKKPDSSKHVNYTKGMVLGVDDFIQEFVYLAGRNQWLARDLVGYGTASGLAVKTEDDGANGPRVHVAAGSALSPRGMLICVPTDQCASLNAWLAKTENAKLVAEKLGAATAGTVPLYLALCYSDCNADPVPIPGEPCRSEDELMAPSRIADDFKLEFRLEPPQQREERALRDFVQWLRSIRVTQLSSPPAASQADLLKALRASAKPWFDLWLASPPTAPALLASPPLADFMYGSPPGSLCIHPDQECELLRVAFRFWVTELRPMWMARCCGNAAAADDCVLLAQLKVPVVKTGAKWQVASSAADIQVDEGERPYLLHQRMLQEWLLCGFGLGTQVEGGANPGGLDGAAIKVDIINSSVTLGASHHCVICTAGGITVTLPACGTTNQGWVYIVKNTPGNGAAPPIVKPNSNSNFIDGSPEWKLDKGLSITLVSDGIDTWHVIAKV